MKQKYNKTKPQKKLAIPHPTPSWNAAIRRIIPVARQPIAPITINISPNASISLIGLCKRKNISYQIFM